MFPLILIPGVVALAALGYGIAGGALQRPRLITTAAVAGGIIMLLGVAITFYNQAVTADETSTTPPSPAPLLVAGAIAIVLIGAGVAAEAFRTNRLR